MPSKKSVKKTSNPSNTYNVENPGGYSLNSGDVYTLVSNDNNEKWKSRRDGLNNLIAIHWVPKKEEN